MWNVKIDRTGEVNTNSQGMEMIIINYINNHDIDIKFADGTILQHVQYYAFKNGKILNHNIPNYLGVGYIGYGIYKSRVNKIKTEEYIKWGSMLTRCYSEKLSQRHNYIDCEVCDEWKNFQNFAKWYNENKYSLPESETLELDKDIKIKHNRIYSPETCLLIPKRLNDIILNRHNNRGDSCVGTFLRKQDGKYIAKCNTLLSKNNYIGVFDTEIEAFNAYKNVKESEIKKMAELYKDKIPNHVYEAILSYTIDITD